MAELSLEEEQQAWKRRLRESRPRANEFRGLTAASLPDEVTLDHLHNESASSFLSQDASSDEDPLRQHPREMFHPRIHTAVHNRYPDDNHETTSPKPPPDSMYFSGFRTLKPPEEEEEDVADQDDQDEEDQSLPPRHSGFIPRNPAPGPPPFGDDEARLGDCPSQECYASPIRPLPRQNHPRTSSKYYSRESPNPSLSPNPASISDASMSPILAPSRQEHRRRRHHQRGEEEYHHEYFHHEDRSYRRRPVDYVVEDAIYSGPRRQDTYSGHDNNRHYRHYQHDDRHYPYDDYERRPVISSSVRPRRREIPPPPPPPPPPSRRSSRGMPRPHYYSEHEEYQASSRYYDESFDIDPAPLDIRHDDHDPRYHNPEEYHHSQTQQQFDDYMSPIIPRKRAEEPALVCPSSINSTCTTVEISPGVRVKLRGAAETKECIRRDFIMECKCFSCSMNMFCIKDAEYVLCPGCRVVNPLCNDDGDPDSKVKKSGLGMGFNTDELMRQQKEILGY